MVPPFARSRLVGLRGQPEKPLKGEGLRQSPKVFIQMFATRKLWGKQLDARKV